MRAVVANNSPEFRPRAAITLPNACEQRRVGGRHRTSCGITLTRAPSVTPDQVTDIGTISLILFSNAKQLRAKRSVERGGATGAVSNRGLPRLRASHS